MFYKLLLYKHKAPSVTGYINELVWLLRGKTLVTLLVYLYVFIVTKYTFIHFHNIKLRH